MNIDKRPGISILVLLTSVLYLFAPKPMLWMVIFTVMQLALAREAISSCEIMIDEMNSLIVETDGRPSLPNIHPSLPDFKSF